MNLSLGFNRSDVASFFLHHAMIGLKRSLGLPTKKAAVARNTQCVKLGKQHDNITKLVMHWCDMRLIKMQQLGINDEELAKIKRADARFLTMLSHALMCQHDDQPEFDAWLFFNENVDTTDFLELQHCNRGSKVTKASFILHATC